MGDAQRRATYINSIARMLEFTQTEDFNNANLALVETRLQFLAERWAGFNNEHLSIVEATVEQDAEANRLNDTVLTTTENRYLAARAALVGKQLALQPNVPPVAAAAAAQPANANGNDGAANQPLIQYQIALPPSMPTLPIFNGEYSQWPEFRDTYVPLVENSDLRPVQKFTVLRNHLSGPAKDVIAGINPSDMNYPTAWRLIRETYENDRLIIQSLLKIIRSLRPLASDDPVGLRFIVVKFRQVIRQLETNNANLVEMTPQLLYDLVHLLDRASRTAFEAKQLKRRQNGRDEFTMEEALDFLHSRAESAIHSPPASNQRAVRPSTPSQANHRHKVYHAAASHDGGSNQ